jgi:hypothetical protein
MNREQTALDILDKLRSDMGDLFEGRPTAAQLEAWRMLLHAALYLELRGRQ